MRRLVVEQIDDIAGGLREEHAGLVWPGIVEGLEVAERVAGWEDFDFLGLGVEADEFVADTGGSVDSLYNACQYKVGSLTLK